jgi:hypothetical protein
MNDLIMYLYGISTGIIMVATLLYAKRQIEKAIYHGFAGSAPNFNDAVKAKLDTRTKDWQKAN